MPENLFKINAKEYILPGTRACQGCGLSLAYRGIYPSTPVMIPALNNSFASTAASASELVAGLQALNRTDTTVVAIAGDGGTFDMGIQALSGAAERGTDFIYVCYDNEGYMNTGTQRSSATPLGALTTTTPIATKQQHKKDFLKIMEAHDIAYLATASPSYPIDLYDKFVKAKKIKGTRYIHLYIPCPPGWSYPPKDTVKMGRLAVETGIATLFEVENGRFRFTGRSKSMAERRTRLPVINYLERQGRFKKMNIEQLHQVQHWVDSKWQEYERRSQE